ncbi:apurinic endonuclease [Gemella bergeri ATCC 700627]|uniref:Probable endonuclease 4 n=1 Tax=Gemella bergeri ATCC 700627 TaxID=1321820 RepID=U2QIS9_9BACL|nr:deoxyribonuclease IV [Gemella bergeri]ERK56114.1 apurinic endonuclease [Gemella bergeri ATCC 700627]
MNSLKIGSHVSMSGKEMMLGSVKEAASYGSDTFMIYTGAPQNTKRKPIEELRIAEAKDLMKEYNISDIVVHAPYIINLGNTIKPEIYKLAVEFLRLEIERTEKIGAKNIVLHPGSHVKAGVDKGIKSIIKGLNEVLTKDMIPNISLEVMAGKGSECGRSFEEIAQIIDGVVLNDKLTVTFDTCHVFEGGYDIVNNLDEVLTQFDKIVGLGRIQVLHINDSKNSLGAHKDRHENIGYGGIGFDAINRIVHLSEFEHIPKILETPWYGENKEFAPYKYEIDMLRRGIFDIDFKKEI